MAIEKTWFLECDGCRTEMKDSDGCVHGNEDYLVSKAQSAGWKRDAKRGWLCLVCVSTPPSGPGEP